VGVKNMPTIAERINFLRENPLSEDDYSIRAGMGRNSVHVKLYSRITTDAILSSSTVDTESRFATIWDRIGITNEVQAERHLRHMVKVMTGNSDEIPEAVETALDTKNKIKADISTSDINIDVAKYTNNILVGFELEMSPASYNSEEIVEKICRNFNIKSGKKSAKMIETTAYMDNPDGDRITVKLPTFVDAYKQPDIVTACYNDGSVGPETVTRPVRYSQLDTEIKPIHSYLKGLGNFDVSQAGLHMTFVLDTHKEKSLFNKRVVRNIMQLIRTYYPLLITKYKNPNTRRGLNFRKLPQKIDVINVKTEKFIACNLRKDRLDNVWGIEMRIPDGTGDFNIIKEQVLVYMCLISHAAKITKLGMLTINRKYWQQIVKFSNYYGSSTSDGYNSYKEQLENQLNQIINEEKSQFIVNENNNVLYEIATNEDE
jgi:hypothetical protein